MERRVGLCTEMVSQPWAGALFREFCGWDGLARTAGDMTRRIDAYAAFFFTIDRHCASRDALGQGLLLRLFGAEGLRRHHVVVRFLVGHLALDWDPGRTEAFTEAGRAEAVLAAADEHPWGSALRAYHDNLTRGPALRPGTIRLYLNAADGLLRQAGHADLAFLKQADVERYLRRKPGQRASLTGFLAYAALALEVRLTAPARKRRIRPKTREKALLRDVRALLGQLDRAGNVGEGRAVLAAAISKIYTVPLSAVLKLRAPDAAVEAVAVTLWPGGMAVGLSSVLADALLRWASWEGDYLFPGRNGAQPLSRDAVRHHVRARPTGGQRQSC